ncbi:MAG: phytoene/squalene synthase family protein [Bradymonadia bacterium]
MQAQPEGTLQRVIPTDGALLTERESTACQALLSKGSKSFAAAALLLPRHMRQPAAALYAFCRVADDAVDDAEDPREGLALMRRRVAQAYAGTPDDDPVDTAFARVVQAYAIPQAVPEALLEGFAWDAEGKVYETLSDVRAYGVRVASTVGVMMTLLMGQRDPEVLARACDLGVAMQLTNIARDVGEDAGMGRIYLPRAWMRERGLDPENWLASPTFSPEIASMVSALLDEAAVLYRRSRAGITALPRDCRLAIRAAELIYADIGRVIRRRGHDSVSGRAYTSKARKLWLLARASTAALWWRRACDAPPLEEAKILIEPMIPEDAALHPATLARAEAGVR